MIPESIGALYAFLGLVTPGLVFQLLRERNSPALDESAFREASRVALTSSVLTTLSVGTLALVSVARPAWVVDAQGWLELGDKYVVDHTALVARTVLVTVVLACVYAWVFQPQSKLRRPRRRVERTDVWWQLLVRDVPRNRVPWVRLVLRDGTSIWGHVDFFTVGKAIDDRHISVTGPGLQTRAKGEEDKKDELYWRRISVRASDVALMKVTYEPRAAKEGRWQRMKNILTRRPTGKDGRH